MGVLGAVLIDSTVLGDLTPILPNPAMFYRPSHMAIYDAMLHLYGIGTDRIDGIQVKQRLADVNQLENVGGVDYLIELAESTPSAAGAKRWAEIVREKFVLRGLIDATGEIQERAFTSADPADTQLDEAERAIFTIAENKGESQEAAPLGELLEETYRRLEAQDGKSVMGVETGFYELDDMTSGLQRGEMIIVAARPSMGKTAFALNLAEHIGINNSQPIAVFSLEMSKQQLAQRMLCSVSGIDSHRVRTNKLNADEFQTIARTCGALSESPVHIDDTPGLSLLALRSKARRLAARHDLAAVVIDYLQLMTAPRSETRQQEVSTLSRGIKALARELNVPVICLSQLNRAAEAREGHRPRMSDLRESGSIEQDADVVMMLHREEYYHRDETWAMNNPEKVGVAELIVAKQRNGPTGTVKLTFDGGTTRFKNYAEVRL